MPRTTTSSVTQWPFHSWSSRATAVTHPCQRNRDGVHVQVMCDPPPHAWAPPLLTFCCFGKDLVLIHLRLTHNASIWTEYDDSRPFSGQNNMVQQLQGHLHVSQLTYGSSVVTSDACFSCYFTSRFTDNTRCHSHDKGNNKQSWETPAINLCMCC